MDTEEQIAEGAEQRTFSRFVGPIDYLEIAALNGLKPPYLSPAGSGTDVLRPGNRVLYPSEGGAAQSSAMDGAAPCNGESRVDELLGRDLRVRNTMAAAGASAVDLLIEALKDNEGAVRKYSAALLGRIRDERAVEPLGMALYDLHHDVGKTAAQALAEFGAISFETLVEALDHPEMWIRIHSVDVLPKVGEPRVALVLLEMLQDPEREVKMHVIQAMGSLKDPRTLPALQEILAQRGDREMHALAKAAIEKIHM